MTPLPPIHTLADLGWNPRLDALFGEYRADGYVPARVSQEHRGQYIVLTADRDGPAVVTGKHRDEAESRSDFPAVGDWIALRWSDDGSLGVIHGILPRASVFKRKAPGRVTEEQIIAANVDTVFLVSGLDHDFNVRRIERYVALAWESGATPVVLLNKADLCAELDERVKEVEHVAIGVDIVPLSATEGDGLDALRVYLAPGKTLALLGSSGVGKSTIINALLHESHMKTSGVRDDDSRGRHTTTHRELVLLPSGGMLIDTPGMRELQLWQDEDSVDRAFEDVTEFATQCRFNDCQHEHEPGCAVQAALASGALDEGRYESYLKLRKELHYLARKQDQRLQAEEKAKWKNIHKEIRRHYKHKQ